MSLSMMEMMDPGGAMRTMLVTGNGDRSAMASAFRRKAGT